MNDPIVDEVRRIREAQSARWNFDLDAIFRALKMRERNSGLVFVNGFARQRALSPIQPADTTPEGSHGKVATPVLEERSTSP